MLVELQTIWQIKFDDFVKFAQTFLLLNFHPIQYMAHQLLCQSKRQKINPQFNIHTVFKC